MTVKVATNIVVILVGSLIVVFNKVMAKMQVSWYDRWRLPHFGEKVLRVTYIGVGLAFILLAVASLLGLTKPR